MKQLRYSIKGKPLCCQCRRNATHRTVDTMARENNHVCETRYIYSCQIHTNDPLSEPLLPLEADQQRIIGMLDVVRYQGCLYRVMGTGYTDPAISDLFLRPLGHGIQVSEIHIVNNVSYPQVHLLQKCTHDWHHRERPLNEMEYNAYSKIRGRG